MVTGEYCSGNFSLENKVIIILYENFSRQSILAYFETTFSRLSLTVSVFSKLFKICNRYLGEQPSELVKNITGTVMFKTKHFYPFLVSYEMQETVSG